MELLDDIQNKDKQKQALILEIDNEIQREYSILNKFTTEKFSIILLILGIIGLWATMWDTFTSHIDLNEFLGFWVLSTFILLIIWMISVCFTINSVRKGKPGPTITIDFILRKFHELINIGEFKKIMDVEKTENRIDEDYLKSYLQKIANYFFVNLDYLAKNTETRMRPIALFFLFLLFIGVIILQNYFGVTVPQIQQTTPFLSLTLFWLIVLYAAIFWTLGFCWNEIFILGKILFKPLGYGAELILKKYTDYKEKWISLFCGSIIFLIYTTIIVLGIGFLLLFPFYVDYKLISHYTFLEVSNAFVKFMLVFFLMYLFFKLFEILFSIHLIERLKNDKIAWLNHVKFNILSVVNSDSEIMNNAKEQVKLADIYSPIPYNSLAAFTRYEIIPIYRYDVTSALIQERLEFLNIKLDILKILTGAKLFGKITELLSTPSLPTTSQPPPPQKNKQSPNRSPSR